LFSSGFFSIIDTSPLRVPHLKPETSTNSNILADPQFPFSTEGVNAGYSKHVPLTRVHDLRESCAVVALEVGATD
jgi:hypothetical protein